ncbi:MAG: metal ABC transporter permease [Gammaproteobacteria bacterium]
MTDFFSALAEYGFLQRALLACVLASIGCGIMGSYVVVKRVGFVAGGIAHTILAGMGIAYYLGNSPLTGALICALIAALLIGLIKLRFKQDEDILIAAFWSVGMAIGVIFISRTPGYNVDLMSYLFGNILLVTRLDLILMLILDVVIAGAVYCCYKQILASAFDEEFARLRKIKVEAIYIMMLCLIALTVVLLVQIAGLILVIALLILPAASAALFVTSLRNMMLLAILFSLLITTGGLALSYRPDLPAGAGIIVFAGMFYGLSLLVCSRLHRR